MTTEEAIEVIEQDIPCEYDTDLIEALEMAIKAMQEPKTDAFTIPKGATNGDVLCMLFPNMHYTLSAESRRIITTIGVASSFDFDWWSAPYKESLEIQEDCLKNDSEMPGGEEV